MTMLRTQNFRFEQFTQQISSVSTEQSQTGVKSSVEHPTRKKLLQTRFASKEHERILKIVNPQEVDSLVWTPRTGSPASGNGVRESLLNFESLSKRIQCTRVCEDASFCTEIRLECATRPLQTWMMILEISPSLPRVFTPSSSNSRKNHNWTSHRSSHRTTSRQPWT